jgi:hypothetical protein
MLVVRLRNILRNTTAIYGVNADGTCSFNGDMEAIIPTRFEFFNVSFWARNKLLVYIYIYIYICCLFSWRYNPLWLYFSQSGSGLWPPRFRGFLITHNDAPQSVGLLWTSDQSVAETST